MLESKVLSNGSNITHSNGRNTTRHRICMLSDFFYPNLGGVEMHIWSLSQCLVEMGHKVIVITHAYEDRFGIRYMTNGVKVYYIPRIVFYDQVTWPTLCSSLPLLRNILIRERISILHAHQSTSSFAGEAVLFAKTLGYKTVFTEHSLYGFSDSGSIHINKVMHFVLSDVDRCICVSNTCRENLCMRAQIHPSMCYVIPNAVDCSKFTPDPTRRFPLNSVNIVIVSRLVYRKGIDLLARIIPKMCAQYKHIVFIIAGDGPKRLILEEIRELYQLQSQMILLGGVRHNQVRDVLVRGHIFLNCSLTESFCIAILEAISCGLLVVSTKVGGISEILPSSMVKLAEPDPDDVCRALIEVLPLASGIMTEKLHKAVSSMYNWDMVARRVECVYDDVMGLEEDTLLDRVKRQFTLGSFVGYLSVAVVITMHIIVCLLDFCSKRKRN